MFDLTFFKIFSSVMVATADHVYFSSSVYSTKKESKKRHRFLCSKGFFSWKESLHAGCRKEGGGKGAVSNAGGSLIPDTNTTSCVVWLTLFPIYVTTWDWDSTINFFSNSSTVWLTPSLRLTFSLIINLREKLALFVRKHSWTLTSKRSGPMS